MSEPVAVQVDPEVVIRNLGEQIAQLSREKAVLMASVERAAQERDAARAQNETLAAELAGIRADLDRLRPMIETDLFPADAEERQRGMRPPMRGLANASGLPRPTLIRRGH